MNRLQLSSRSRRNLLVLQKALLKRTTKNPIGSRSFFTLSVRISGSIGKTLMKHTEDNVLRGEKFDVDQGHLS